MTANQEIVIITGGSGGLGQALALEHLHRGDTVIITGRDKERLRVAYDKLGNNPNLHIYVLDVTDNEAVRVFAAWVQIHFIHCDLLYNNAGTAVFKPFVEMSLDEIHQTVDTNINGIIYMTRAFLPMMLTAKSGQIVNIASLAGEVATAKAALYAATKAAVIRLSEGLRVELGKSGIGVTCVMPGPIDTPFLDVADTTGIYRQNVRHYLLDAKRSARIIVRAVKAGKPEVALPRKLYLLGQMYKWLPDRIKRMVSPLINRK